MKKYIFKTTFVLLAHISFAQGIFISNGGTIHTDGNATICIENGSFINDGTFNANGSTMTFQGNASSANSSIGGATQTVFNNIVVNKNTNSLQLNQSIKVNGNLTFTLGGVELKAGDIDFGTTGSLQNETELNKVFGTGGKLIATAALNAPTSINPANLGAIITSSQDLGITTVQRAHNVFGTLPLSIQRNYVISPTNNAALNATLRLRYFANELNGNDENTMVMARSEDNGVSFSPKTISLRSTQDNFAEATGINAFSIWTLTSASILPIDLLYFKGFAKNGLNLLNWATATESNNIGFDIERSNDGLLFSKIGFVKGFGNSNAQKQYNFTDNTPLVGINYYRLKQKDNDGKFTYSPTIVLNQADKKQLLIYPNPATNDFTLVTNEAKPLPFSMANSLGRIVMTGTVTNSIDVDIQMLSTGLYTLVCGQQIMRFVKN
jgi:Secretion system C-terminal sorting domain